MRATKSPSVMWGFLQDKVSIASCIKEYVKNNRADMFGKNDPEDEQSKCIQEWWETQALVNLDRIHEYSGSPLETAFFTSLLLSFHLNDPFDLVIESPAPSDIEQGIKRRMDEIEESFRLYLLYKNLPEDARPATFSWFLQSLIDDPKSGMTEEEAYRHGGFWFYEYDCKRHHAIRVTLQPVFKDFYGPGKDVRADALCWVPSNPEMKVVIELDGFEHHASKDAFIADRIRDRQFIERGYLVRRYSGSEVYADVPGATNELVHYLVNNYSFGAARSEHWEKEFSDKYRTEITPLEPVIAMYREITALQSAAGGR